MEPRRLLPWARRATVIAAVVAGLYLWSRFELLDLPAAGCSPLLSIAPGTTLWVDTRPPAYVAGDVAFFEGPAGDVLIAVVDSVPAPGRYWLLTDNEACPSDDSRELGAIPAERMRGRVVFAGSFP